MRPRRVELDVVAVAQRHHVQRLGAGEVEVETTLQFQPCARARRRQFRVHRSEEHTSELQSLMRISYAVFCLKKKKTQINITTEHNPKDRRHQHDYKRNVQADSSR